MLLGNSAEARCCRQQAERESGEHHGGDRRGSCAPVDSALGRDRRVRLLDELLALAHVLAAPQDQRRTLVDRGRLDVEDSAPAVARRTPGRLGDERERGRFVEHPQFALRVPAVAGIEEDAAIEQVAVEVRDQRAGVARAVGAVRRGVVDLEPVHVALGAIGPAEVVPLVDAVDPAARRGVNLGVGEQELADRGLEREAVHAVAGGVDQHGARAVHDVAGAQLAVSRLQAVLKRAAAFARHASQHREDGADIDVGVDVRRAVQGVEVEHVLARGLILRRRHDVLVLLRDQHGELAGPAQHAVERLVRELVEPLHLLAVHVLAPGVAQDVHQARADDLGVDHLGRERDVGEQLGELAGRLGVQPLLLEDELLQGERAVPHRAL